MGEFLYGDFLSPENHLASRRTGGAEQAQLIYGEFTLVKHLEKLLAHGATGANDSDIHCLEWD